MISYSETLQKIKDIKSSCYLCAAIDRIILDAESSKLPPREIIKKISKYDGMLCGAAENKKHTALDALRYDLQSE